MILRMADYTYLETGGAAQKTSMIAELQRVQSVREEF